MTVTNTGPVAGDEVVQAYFHPPDSAPSSGGLPLIKQLYGFERVTLGAGESTTVYFSVGADTLLTVSPEGDSVAHPGRYGLSFTNGVSETVLGNVTLTGSEPLLGAKDTRPLFPFLSAFALRLSRAYLGKSSLNEAGRFLQWNASQRQTTMLMRHRGATNVLLQ